MVYNKIVMVVTWSKCELRLWYARFFPPRDISHNSSQEISACDGGWFDWSCDPLQESWRKLGGRRCGREP